MKKIIIYLVVMLQIIALVILIRMIILTKISTSVLSTSDYDQDSSILPGFFEPKANIVINEFHPGNKELRIRQYINNDTLHHSRDISLLKEKNVQRVILLGDSFAFGQYVQEAENLSSQLELLFNSTCTKYQFEIINLGVPGYDLEYAAKRLILRGEKYKPNYVFWIVKSDDFREINSETFHYKMSLKERMEQDGTILREQQKGNYYPYVIEAISKLQLDWGEEKILAYQERVLKETISLPFTFFIFSENDLSNVYEQLVRQIVKSSSDRTFFYPILPKLDITEKLSDGHPNAKGYARYATIMQSIFIQRFPSLCMSL